MLSHLPKVTEPNLAELCMGLGGSGLSSPREVVLISGWGTLSRCFYVGRAWVRVGVVMLGCGQAVQFGAVDLPWKQGEAQPHAGC